MNGIMPVSTMLTMENTSSAVPARHSSFGDKVMSGVASVEQSSAAAADALVSYAAGNDVSAHELMISMEKARLSLQLMVEVRNRLVESYQEITRLQI